MEHYCKSQKNNWKYFLDISANSLDVEKLDKATELNSFLTINLSKEEIINKVNQPLNNDLDESKYNLKKSDDLTFNFE